MTSGNSTQREAGGVLPDFMTALVDERETIDCPLCGSSTYDSVYEGVALRGNALNCVICRQCTHLFLNPRPTLDAFRRFYAGDPYFHLCADFSGVSFEEKMEQFDDDAFWQRRFDHGERLFNEYLNGQLGAEDIVFDFGCGDGAWLWALRELTGCKVDGEEISDIYAEVIRRKLGVEIFVGPAEDLTEDIVARYAGQVKVAIVSGSLQHMLRPMDCLRAAREILRPDGYLYVCNWSLFEHYMTSYEGDRRRLLGETLSWEHLHYLHESSFRYMLEAAGFELLDMRLESSIRPRHMDALGRPSNPIEPRPIHDSEAVVRRLRALESATIAERLSPVG
jgi:SAM-dependent methyltransferase